MAVEQKVTFCRICEPLCGMVATVEDGVVTQLRPDKDHPLSRGYACPKGIAMTDVQNDPDRVLHPLKRAGGPASSSASPGTRRSPTSPRGCGASIAAHGPQSVGWYMGNPGAFSYCHTLWVKGFLDGARHAALLHGRLAGREQPLRRVRAALRLAAAAPDPGPQAHALPADGRREPARLARLRALRAAGPRAAARRSSSAAAAWSSSTRAAPRPRGTSSTSPSAPTPTPGCCSRCST